MKQLALACLSMALVLGTARADLKVGDPAPPLKITKWIKGKPVKLSDGKGKQIYVVEFWATWCGPCRMSIPHLTKIAKHFEKKNVTFMGGSIDESATADQVEPSVKSMGDKMDYTVGWDGKGETNKDYMVAAGARGIPHAFLISREGKIAWQGHPMSGLDFKIAEMVGDREYAANAKKLMDLQDKLQKAFRAKNWDDGISALDDLMKLQPDEDNWPFQKYVLLVIKKDKPAVEKWGPQLLKKVNDAEILNRLAWGILADDFFEGIRDIPFALKASKKARDLTEDKNWMILDTHARALFETNSIQEARKTQEKAIEIATKENVAKRNLDTLKETLERYQKKGE